MNAGIRVMVGTSSAFAGLGNFDRLTNRAISFSLVCENMNFLTGATAFLNAASWLMVPALYGMRASLLICCQTGAMMKKVRNRESPTIIWLEGACWAPMALRRKERTTTVRVNDVVMI